MRRSDLTLIRYDKTSKGAVMGLLYDNGKLIAYTMENYSKMITAGSYFIKTRDEITPMTRRYREKLPWFEYFPEVMGVSGRSHLYFHIGNFPRESNGCILVGARPGIIRHGDDMIRHSTRTFKEVYTKIMPQLIKGMDIDITIKDLKI